MRTFIAISTSVLLFASACKAKPFSYQESLFYDDNNVAPLYMSPEAETISNSYIVILKDHLNVSEVKEHTAWIDSISSVGSHKWSDWLDPHQAINAGIEHVYNAPNLKGYSGKFDKYALEVIRRSNDVSQSFQCLFPRGIIVTDKLCIDQVAFVEQDSIAYTNELQRNAPWGLSRVSHVAPLTFKNYQKYQYDPEAGAGVKIYIIDTGILIGHVEFEGRAIWGTNVIRGEPDNDGHGHGTHVAGTASGKTYGIAKKAIPIAVKVIGPTGNGPTSHVIRGVDWVTNQHLKEEAEAKANGTKYKGAVANMSLGVMKSLSMDKAVNAGVDAGVVFVVAGGNNNGDACEISPARAENVITVGASTISDERAFFSNYGECIDLFAPGFQVLSAWKGNRHDSLVGSGTSMASPHVAGLAAYFLSLEDEKVTPKYIKDKILRLATRDALDDLPPYSPNLLAYNGYDEDQEDFNKGHTFKVMHK